MPRRRNRKKRDPETKQLRTEIMDLFREAGFSRVMTEGTDITFSGVTSDIDMLFIFENILVFCEYTTGLAKPNDHLRKASDFFQAIMDSSKQDLLNTLDSTFPEFLQIHNEKNYDSNRYQIKCLYVSPIDFDATKTQQHNHMKFMSHNDLRYFLRIAKAIRKSSRFEIFKFLDMVLEDIGDIPSSERDEKFRALVLPRDCHMFEKCDCIVSFFASPEFLLEQSYVLRKWGWKDTKYLYQRLLTIDKINKIRNFIVDYKRAFVNNILVSLPSDVTFKDDKGTIIDRNDITATNLKKNVNIIIPKRMEGIGIIDGQHRVFAYYEGRENDKHEHIIKRYRTKQHLLVTGLLFKEGITQQQREQFEAALFKEINSKQDDIPTSLIQEIEAILEPNSRTAISKLVIGLLNSESVLGGLLDENPLSPGKHLKTASIIKYGLNNLISDKKIKGLWSLWNEKYQLGSLEDLDVNKREEYAKFCYGELKQFLSAFVKGHENLWDLENEDSRMLTVTTINGLLYFLIMIIEKDKAMGFNEYIRYFKNLNYEKKFKKGEFKGGSAWKGLGIMLYETAFNENPESTLQ